MTENKRYSDGSLAKWYYSRDYSGMRVISNGVDEFVLNSKKQFKDINSEELKGTNQLLDELNKLEDIIINLKKELYDITIDYYTETYSDNSFRRDEHIKDFKEEFKAKYGDVE